MSGGLRAQRYYTSKELTLACSMLSHAAESSAAFARENR